MALLRCPDSVIIVARSSRWLLPVVLLVAGVCGTTVTACGAEQYSTSSLDASAGDVGAPGEGGGLDAGAIDSGQRPWDAADGTTAADADADVDDGASTAPDAGDVVSEDAASEASPDSATLDGSDDVADAVVDSASTACTPGPATRCDDYRYETCPAGQWTWSMGNQSCCYGAPGRFTLAATTALDTTTSLTWRRDPTFGAVSCDACPGGFRCPTRVELLSIVIGTPDPDSGVAVCEPTLDQHTFVGPWQGTLVALGSDGCLSFAYGAPISCATADLLICVQ